MCAENVWIFEDFKMKRLPISVPFIISWREFTGTSLLRMFRFRAPFLKALLNLMGFIGFGR